MTKDQIRHDALAATQLYRRCGLGVTMGGGKTSIGLHHMDRKFKQGCRKFLVVAPKKAVFKSWEDDAVKFGLDYLLPYITYTTYLSLPKQSLNYDWLYLDECHSLLYSHDFWLTQFGGGILGLTGTPPRFKGSEKGQMVAKFCPIVYSYITDDAVEDGILNDYRIIIHHLFLGDKKNVASKTRDGRIWYQSEQNAYGYWHNRITDGENKIKELEEQIKKLESEIRSGTLSVGKLSEKAAKEKEIQSIKAGFQQLRIMRMKALMNTPTKVRYASWLLENARFKTIVFANTQEQAEELCPNSYHANNPDSETNLEMFKNGQIQCLASVMQLSEGINIPDLREGIILHAYSNERKSSQRLGRLLRLNPDDTSLMHILCFDGTKDEDWVNEALADFDPEKIFHYYPHRNWFVDYYGRDISGLEMPYGMYTPPVYNKPLAVA